MSTRKSVDVMLSVHCGTMLASANQLKKYLIQRGYSVFLCDQMLGGVKYRDEISFNASTCQAMVAFINHNWCISGECAYEFNIALRSFLQKWSPKIIPILLEDFSEYDKYATVKGVLCNLNGFPVKPVNFDDSFWEKIVNSLRSLGILPEGSNTRATITTAPYTEIPFSALSDMKYLTAGATGKIYSAVYRGERVAVKVFNQQGLTEQQTMRFKLEVFTMASLHSRYIVHLIGASTEAPNLAIVMELTEGGSLSNLLESDVELSWGTRLQMIEEIALGIQVLHTNKPMILHRDLKSLNILLDSSHHCKIADFGLAVIKETTASHSALDSIGTVSWMAPEVLSLRPKYSTKSDIYSLAMIMWEFAARRMPYLGASPAVVHAEVRNGEREEIPDGCPPGFAELITKCWHQDPAQRPSIQNIIEEIKSIKKQIPQDPKEDIKNIKNHTPQDYIIYTPPSLARDIQEKGVKPPTTHVDCATEIISMLPVKPGTLNSATKIINSRTADLESKWRESEKRREEERRQVEEWESRLPQAVRNARDAYVPVYIKPGIKEVQHSVLDVGKMFVHKFAYGLADKTGVKKMKVSPDITNCIQKGICTYAVTNRNLKPQNIYQCLTCNMNGGVCETCKDNCHEGHKFVSYFEPCACDCIGTCYPCPVSKDKENGKKK